MKRDKELNIHGYRVYRVYEEEFIRGTENVIREIESYIGNIKQEENITPCSPQSGKSLEARTNEISMIWDLYTP
ncbi:MAG: hypothetical protein R2764_18120 [Bacteroidales bacterium]